MSKQTLPAWSEPFADPRRQLKRGLRLRGVTRQWAWGDATGAGVRVGIIDSGLENAHPALRGRVVENVTVRREDRVLWFPAGLVLYWVTNNTLGILQQWLITRQIENADNKA